MIRLEHVTKRYGGLTAVDDLSFEVPDGEVCVLIGPSGCGKTTTLRMINRLVTPTSGSIYLGGVDTRTMPVERLRRGLGYAIQSVGLFPHLTVAENIATVPKLLHWDRSRIDARVRELLALVGLDPDEYAGTYPRQLSGGEAQRVGVARALAADPPVLLMDEPFGAVDPLTRERLQGEFARIQRDLRKTVVFVTHDVDEAIRLADRIALMREGRLQQYDTPENIFDHPANKFVHDFMGADRALKRLGRVRAGDVMRLDPERVEDGSVQPALLAQTCGPDTHFAYLVAGDSGTLEGWIDCRLAQERPDEAVTRADWRTIAIRPDATLKEALSRMLDLGFRALAVTDAEGRLIGEVAFSDVERAMSRGDSHVARGGPGEEPRS